MTAGLIELGEIMMTTSQRRLQAVSEDISNVATPGFKAHESFEEAITGAAAQADAHSFTDFSQGGLQHTGRALDLAISGAGFFVLKGEDATYYSRSGQFTRTDDGRVTDPRGFALQTTEGGDLVLRDASVTILADGAVLENGLPVAHIAVAEAQDLSQMQALGGSLFTAPDGLMQETPSPVIRSGMIETSNVDSAAEMLQLMASMRQAEAGARVVQAYDSLVGQAITTFGRSPR